MNRASLRFRLRPQLLAVLLCVLALGALAPSAEAQPFGAWYTNNGTWRYVAVPHHSSLNVSGAFTLEAWILLFGLDSFESRPIVGKGYADAWLIFVGRQAGSPYLGSVFGGFGGAGFAGGTIPLGTWTHIAVTSDGTHRRHYINGELAAEFATTGAPPGNSDDLWIGSDPHEGGFSPNGAIDEVRLWNVARTRTQLRATLNRAITAAQPGLVAVWPLDGNGNDVIGARDGSLANSPTFSAFPPMAHTCGASTPSALCLNTRYRVRAWWRTNAVPGSPVDGQATTVASTAPDSGLFWFFGPDNWEVMVKVLNGCPVNGQYWVFSAATTNVFYRLEVTDVNGREQKIYFNYPGPPAPAVTDTDAFANCP